MGRLLHFELRRLFRGKLLYVFSGILTFFAIIICLPSKNHAISAQETVYNCICFIYMVYTAMIGAWMVSLWLAPDYSRGGILPNVVSRGYSRISVFATKYITMLVLHAVAFAVAMVAGLAVGLPFSEGAMPQETAKQLVNPLLFMLISGLATMNLVVFVSVACGKRLGVVLSALITNPMAGFMAYIFSMFDGTTKQIGDFLINWYPPFGWIKVLTFNVLRESQAIRGIQVKLDLTQALIAALIITVPALGGAILIASRKEVNK